MTKILAAIAALDWTFAKTMPEQLHEYTLRKDNPDDFARPWQAVEEHGRPELWNGRRYRYLYPGDGWRYWVMPRYRFILNRARVADPQPPVRP